jgi:hypothetical protein
MFSLDEVRAVPKPERAIWGPLKSRDIHLGYRPFSSRSIFSSLFAQPSEYTYALGDIIPLGQTYMRDLCTDILDMSAWGYPGLGLIEDTLLVSKQVPKKANDWIGRLTKAGLGGIHLRIWDATLRHLRNTGVDVVSYKHANGGYKIATGAISDAPLITDIQQYKSPQSLTLDYITAFRVRALVYWGWDLQLESLILIASLLLLLTAILIAACSAIGMKTPAGFQTPKKDMDRIDISCGGTSAREKREGRMAKEGHFAELQAGNVVRQAATIVCNNYIVEFISDEDSTTIAGLFMDEKNFYFPYHGYAYLNGSCTKIILYPDFPEKGCRTGLSLDPRQFSVSRIEVKRDLGCIHFRQAPVVGMRSIWTLARSKNERDPDLPVVYRNLSAVINGRRMFMSEGPFRADFTRNSALNFRITEPGKTPYVDSNLDYYLVPNGEGYAGYCGYAYTAPEGSNKPLLGLHMARLGVDSLVVAIYAEDRDPVLQAMPRGLEERIDPTIPGPDIKGAKFFGRVEGTPTSVNDRSEYRPNFSHPEDMFDVKVKPNLRIEARQNRAEATFNFGVTPITRFPQLKLPDFYRSFHDQRKLGLCRKLTFEEALFGAPEINVPSFATASKFTGMFFDKPKSELVDFDNRTYHPDLKARVMEYFDQARFENIQPVAQHFPKDELLDRAKVYTDTPMCRIVNGHDLAYNIALRMLFGHLIQNVIDHALFGVCTMGIDPVSSDWKFVYEKFNIHPHGIGGDLSKQEATTGDEFKEAFKVFIRSCMDSDPDLDTIIDNFLDGLNGFYFLSEGFLYFTMRGHSSGHLLTYLYNCFQVWTAHKLIFQDTLPQLIFEEHVALRVGGDDSIGTVSEEAKEFNMLSLEIGFRKLFGMKYTGPEKDKKISAFLPRNEWVFLGREFIVEGDKVIGRLRMEAIYGMLCYHRPIKGLEKAACIQIRTDAALRELVLYGVSTFNSVIKMVSPRYGKTSLKPKFGAFAEVQRKVTAGWNRNDHSEFVRTAVPAKVFQ